MGGGRALAPCHFLALDAHPLRRCAIQMVVPVACKASLRPICDIERPFQAPDEMLLHGRPKYLHRHTRRRQRLAQEGEPSMTGRDMCNFIEVDDAKGLALVRRDVPPRSVHRRPPRICGWWQGSRQDHVPHEPNAQWLKCEAWVYVHKRASRS